MNHRIRTSIVSAALAVATNGFGFQVNFLGLDCNATHTPTLRTVEVERPYSDSYYVTYLDSRFTLACEDGRTRVHDFSSQLSTDWETEDEWHWTHMQGVPATVTYRESDKVLIFTFSGEAPGPPYHGAPPEYQVVPDPYWSEFNTGNGPPPLEIWSSESSYPPREAMFSEYDPGEFYLKEYQANPGYPLDANGNDVFDPNVQARFLAQVWSKRFPAYTAKIYCFPGKGDNDLFNRPMLVGDAFDPASSRDPNILKSKTQYQNLLSTTHPHAPRTNRYDIFFVDFGQGGGDILINASLLTRTLEWLSQKTSGRILVGGPSMSGVVSRLALLYALPANNTRRQELAGKVSGYISIDSPHQGASISSSLQHAVYWTKKDVSLNALLTVGTALSVTPWVPKPPENPAIQNWRDLNVPAAHQMLYEHYYDGDRHSSAVWRQFYDFLGRKGGYRRDIPSVAIAASNFYSPWNPTKTFLHSARAAFLAPPTAPIDITLGGISSVPRHELAPGSTGDWFYSSFKRSPTQYMYPEVTSQIACTDNFIVPYGPKGADMNVTWTCNPGDICNFRFYGRCHSNWENFKGTFIPIYSALGLSGYSRLSDINAQNVKDYTPFNKVIWMGSTYNGYCDASGGCRKLDQCESGSNCSRKDEDKRFEHIIFDMQVMKAIDDGAKYLARRHPLQPIMSLLLD